MGLVVVVESMLHTECWMTTQTNNSEGPLGRSINASLYPPYHFGRSDFNPANGFWGRQFFLQVQADTHTLSVSVTRSRVELKSVMVEAIRLVDVTCSESRGISRWRLSVWST